MEDSQESVSPETTDATSQEEAMDTQPSHELETLKAKNDELEAKNRQLFERARKAEEKAKSVKAEQPDSQGLDQSLVNDLRDELTLKVDGYSDEEIAKMKMFAAGAGKRLSEVKSDAFIQSGISAMREKNKSDTATPPPSQRSSESGGTRGKAWAAMTEEERKANFNAHAGKFAKKGRSYS